MSRETVNYDVINQNDFDERYAVPVDLYRAPWDASTIT
jgi:hypothetical protein